MPGLRSAHLFREHAVRTLRPYAGLPVRYPTWSWPSSPAATCAARLCPTCAGSRWASPRARSGFAPMPPTRPATGWSPADGPDAFCRACRLNRVIPDLNDPANILLWRLLEAAKHRLVYGLLRFGLPVVSKFDDPERGLAFAFLSGSWGDMPGDGQVITGHGGGLITIDIAEADDVAARAAPPRDGRAVPHAARPFPPRDRPLLLGPTGA